MFSYKNNPWMTGTGWELQLLKHRRLDILVSTRRASKTGCLEPARPPSAPPRNLPPAAEAFRSQWRRSKNPSSSINPTKRSYPSMDLRLKGILPEPLVLEVLARAECWPSFEDGCETPLRLATPLQAVHEVFLHFVMHPEWASKRLGNVHLRTPQPDDAHKQTISPYNPGASTCTSCALL